MIITTTKFLPQPVSMVFNKNLLKVRPAILFHYECPGYQPVNKRVWGKFCLSHCKVQGNKTKRNRKR